jgi:hypothetical protein
VLIRTGALVFCDTDVALIRHPRAAVSDVELPAVTDDNYNWV